MPTSGSGSRWILFTNPAGLCARWFNGSGTLFVLFVGSGALFKTRTAGAVGGTAAAIVVVNGSFDGPVIGRDAAPVSGSCEGVTSRAR